jgi:polysaccharide export outer membrane protein
MLRRTWARLVTAGAEGVVVIGLVAGCSNFGPPLPSSSSTEYELGSGDEVRIITFGDDKLTGQFKVSDQGDIAMPLLGNVHAAGNTPGQLSRQISGQLKAKELVNNPSVSVEILNYRPVFILGEVTRPGQYPYQPGMTVQQAVSMAGGFTYRAVEDRMQITRKIDGRADPVDGAVNKSAAIRPGDVITVKERLF